MTTGPASVPVARVPRSRIDDLYVTAHPLPEIRVGTGVVVSIDGDTATVLMFDEEIGGVVWLGFRPPAVGDAVEVEARGDLLVIPDTFTEGETVGAAHIVDDTDPGGPDPAEVNIGGAMRSADPWTFDANAHGWRRALDVSGVGIHCWQAAGVLKSRNLMPTPSFETGIGLWESNLAFGTQAAAALSQDPGRYVYGTKSLKVVWPDKGASGGSNAVHPTIAVDPAKRWTLSVHVYIPEGSPDVRACGLFSNGGPFVTEREQWVWTSVDLPAGSSGDYLGVSTVDPVAGTLCWVDAVVLRETGTPFPPGLTYFDGSLPNTAELSFAWEGAAFASASTWYDGQIGAPGTGVLWSTQPFDVAGGDRLDLAAVLSKYAGANATAQLAVCYSPDPDRDPVTTTDPVITYGAALAIGGDDVALAASATVPGLLPDGVSSPARAVIGFQLAGAAGTSDLVVESAVLTQTAATWPIGSLWLNPAVGQALPTVGSTDITSTSSGGVLGTATAFARAPNTKKALVTAPPDCGGFVLAFSTFSIVGINTNNVTLEIATQIDGALSTPGASVMPLSRINSSMASPAQLPMMCQGSAVLGAGMTAEIYLTYRYASAPGATTNQLRGHSMVVLFIPTGVANGDPATPAPISFWDGDSWRPGNLKPATMDLTKDATTVEPGKTATATTIARSDSDIHSGAKVTLTSTTAPAPAGSVTFYKATSAAGPWTSLGAATVSGGKATKSVELTGSTTWYFRATYGGSATHAASTSATTTVRVRTKSITTKTLNAKWVQAYSAGGNKIPVGTFDAGAHQGASSGSDPSNRRSVIGFPQPGFTGADVNVTRVTLVCKAWERWQASNNQGTLVVGWHEITGAGAPGSYPFDKAHNDRSRHSKGEGSWTANLTGWADDVVLRGDFGGISIGPGGNDSNEFGGFSDNGPGKWQLEVEAESWS